MTVDIASKPEARVDRILIVDDNRAIHDDFRKILTGSVKEDTLDEMARDLFGGEPHPAPSWSFVLDSAYQGQEALARVRKALSEDDPYEVAFLDVRMPPGWDGLDTLEALWRVDPNLHVVLCTAFADYSWEEITARVGESDRLLILKKPFHSTEVRQLAQALSTKWRLARTLERRFADLEATVVARTRDLEQTNLRLQREMDERANTERALRRAHRMEALGRLAAGLGHEINNPLTFLMGNLESIQFELESHGEALPSEARGAVEELLETTLVGTERIAQIVRDIKLVARPTRGSEEPRAAAAESPATSLADIVARAVETATQETRGRHDIALDLADAPSVQSYVTELEQAFVILIENISRVAGERWSKARMRVLGRSDEARSIRLEISASAVPGAAGARKEFSGSIPLVQHRGLGLSIARALLMKLDGVIEVEDEGEDGIAFVVRLPASQLAAGPDADDSAKA